MVINRKSVSLLFAVLLTLLLSNMAEAHVGLNVPVGGEVFVVEEVVRIEWIVLVSHTQDNWDLFFSPDAVQLSVGCTKYNN